MPNYDYYCKGCEKEFSEFQMIANRRVPCEKPCTECGGEVDILMRAPMPIDPFHVSGLKQPTDAFKEKMRLIKKSTPGSVIDSY